MKKLFLYSLLYLSVVFFNACNKPRDGHTTVQGQVVDIHTGMPVANATISLMRHKLGNMGAAYSFVQSWVTNTEGRFDTGFEGDENYSYVLLAESPLGHYTPWDKAPSLTPGRKNKDLKVPAQAPAWVKVQLVDEAPTNSIVFYIQGCKERLQNNLYLSSDTTFIVTVDGGISTTLYYWITKNDIKTSYSKLVNPSPLDTVNLFINY